MFFIGLLDIPGLILSGTITGVFGFVHFGFCDSPRLLYFLGCFAEFTWHAQTCSSLLLAINRCIVMTTRSTADLLFKGTKTWFYICIPLVYGIYAFLFVKPVIMSTVLMTWLFNPHFGVYLDPTNYYVSYLHVANNFMVVTTIPSIYIGFTLVRYCRNREHLDNNSVSKKQVGIFRIQ